MWLMFALGSALFSGTTAVLAKYGMKKVDSDLAVALRSVVILAFAWLSVLITGSYGDIGRAKGEALVFPLLSGITNALSWICYFKALRTCSVSQAASIDKAGITLTIVGGWLFLHEPMTGTKLISIPLIIGGARLMIEQTQTTDKGSCASKASDPMNPCPKPASHKSWWVWSVASAVLASATTLLSKAGVEKLSSDLGFAIRTCVMFVIAWATVIGKQKQSKISEIDRKTMLFVGLSGLSTALAWLCYFRALALPGAQAGIVQPIDKLSILVSVFLARVVFKEKLKRRSAVGLLILTVGILILLLPQ